MARARRGLRIVTTTAAAVALLGAMPGVAHAGGPGDWTQLSGNPADNAYPQTANTDEPTIARFGPGLQVVWRAKNSTSLQSYYSAEVDAVGATTTPATPIITDWSGLIDNPRLIGVGDQRMLVFSGLTSLPGSPFGTTGAAYYATGTTAAAMTPGLGSLSHVPGVYAASGFDAVNNAGTPMWVGNPGSTNGLWWHSGIAPTIPAPDGSDLNYLLTNCCAYDAAVARDAVSGIVYGAFFSLSAVGSEKGIWVGQIAPTSTGWSRAPGSFVDVDGAIDTASPNQRLALAASPNGGVFLAYRVMTTSGTSLRLWRVGSASPLVVPQSDEARDVSLAAAPDGSLWISWVTSDLSKVRAVHTDAGVTRFGAIRSIEAPTDYGRVWKTALDASGPVSLVVTAENAQSAFNVFHQQVTEVLMVTTNKSSVPRGKKFKAIVEIATGPVAGATVKAFGDTYTTNANGKAKITVPTDAATGKQKVKATKAPYGKGKTTIKVTK